VVELLRHPGVAEQWKERCEESFRESRQRGGGGPFPHPSDHHWSLADCYLVLALRHNSERHRNGRISLFQSNESGGRYYYSQLTHISRRITSEEQLILEDCLAQVEADLRASAFSRATPNTARLHDQSQVSTSPPVSDRLNNISPSANGEILSEPDGPFGTDGFRFRGVEVAFGRAALQRGLVLALWDIENHRPQEARPIEAVLHDVYGDGHALRTGHSANSARRSGLGSRELRVPSPSNTSRERCV